MTTPPAPPVPEPPHALRRLPSTESAPTPQPLELLAGAASGRAAHRGPPPAPVPLALLPAPAAGVSRPTPQPPDALPRPS